MEKESRVSNMLETGISKLSKQEIDKKITVLMRKFRSVYKYQIRDEYVKFIHFLDQPVSESNFMNTSPEVADFYKNIVNYSDSSYLPITIEEKQKNQVSYLRGISYLVLDEIPGSSIFQVTKKYLKNTAKMKEIVLGDIDTKTYNKLINQQYLTNTQIEQIFKYILKNLSDDSRRYLIAKKMYKHYKDFNESFLFNLPTSLKNNEYLISYKHFPLYLIENKGKEETKSFMTEILQDSIYQQLYPEVVNESLKARMITQRGIKLLFLQKIQQGLKELKHVQE